MASAGRRAITVIAALGGAAALFAAAGVSSAEAASSSGVSTTTVNIRTGASTSAAVVGRLVRGQQITITGAASGDWVKVRFRSGTAYMDAEYLDRSGARPAAPKTAAHSGHPDRHRRAQHPLRRRALAHRVVGELAEGSAITLTGRYSGGYAEFRHQGSLRWVSAAYLAESFGTAGPLARVPPSRPDRRARPRSAAGARGRSPSPSVAPSSASRTSSAPRARVAGTAPGSPRRPGARPGSRSPAPRTPR